MMAEMVYPILVAMVSTQAMAGTYGEQYSHGERRQTETTSENYPEHYQVPIHDEQTIETPPHHVEEIYTRTIVRPVSYSFISANIQPAIHTTSQISTAYTDTREGKSLPRSAEDTDEAEESQQRFSVGERGYLVDPDSSTVLSQQLFIGRKTVLPGNSLDRYHQHYKQLAPAPQPQRSGSNDDQTLLTDSSGSRPTVTSQAVPPVAAVNSKQQQPAAPRDSTTPRREHVSTPNTIQGKPRPKPQYYNGRTVHKHKKNQVFPPIPEKTLRPPALPSSTLRPIVVLSQKPQFYPGEYRNQHAGPKSNYHSNTIPLDVEEKSSTFLEKHRPAPREELAQPWKMIKPEPSQPNTPYVDFYPNKPKPQPNFEEDEIEENENEVPAASNTEQQAASNHGGGGGGERGKGSAGGSQYDEHHEGKKGEKGEKGNKKTHKHEKAAKGHHDKEAHKGEYSDEKGQVKKHHKGEGFKGEQHKEKKGEKAKKYGGAKKKKKGHTTHGEHNIVKKDEYIKSTKFYDEDHGGGEEEEHGEYKGSHAEKEEAKKEAGHNKKGYHKEEKGKKGHHDKGHDDEEHVGYETEEGNEDFFGLEEDYEDKKGVKTTKKWGKGGKE